MNLKQATGRTQLKWVTREHVHVDRVACPWLIRRFVDPKAQFIFAASEDVEKVATEQDAIPFDAPGVELSHKGDRCSFDAIVEKYGLKDQALLDLATMVRAADSGRTDLAPESIGLEAIASGSMMIVANDLDAIDKQAFVYDSLYAYCKLRLLRQRHASELDKMDKSSRLEFLRSHIRDERM